MPNLLARIACHGGVGHATPFSEVEPLLSEGGPAFGAHPGHLAAVAFLVVHG